jgi:alcohol dehydrogenase
MRQLTYRGNGELSWEDVEDPQLSAPTSALVRPVAVARCDLDLPMVREGLFPGPYGVGHEIAGQVIAVGDDVAMHRAGDLVVVPFQVSCGTCTSCEHRTFAACSTHRAPIGASFGFGAVGGSFGAGISDIVAVPHADHLLVAAPSGIAPTALAGISDNVTDGYRAVADALTRHPGADVLITAGGLPSIPLYAAATALALGASSVRYLDSDPERVTAAASIGADAEVRAGPWPRRLPPATITVDATGTPDGLECTLRSTRPYGVCTVVAIYFQPVPLDLLELYTRGITIHTSRVDSRQHIPDVLRLVNTGRLDPLAIPTTIAPWDQAADAWLTPATKLIVQRNHHDTNLP